MIRHTLLLASLGGTLLCSACDRGAPSVVVYVSTDESVAAPILQEFQRDTGIEVLIVGDTEASKTTGLLERLRAERSAPVADVLWSSEAIGTVALANEGVLAPHRSARTEEWPAEWRDSQHRWHAFSPRPRVLVFDPRRLDASEVPQSWMELSNPKWKDQLVCADPRFGTTGGHFAAIREWCDQSSEGDWEAWLDGLAANHTRILPGGNAAVVDSVFHGEALLGATDADDVHAANRQGAALSMVIPRHGTGIGAGPMLMPNTVAVIQGAPHPREATLLADWLLTPQVARRLAESVSANIPLDSVVAKEFPQLHIDDPMELDMEAIERTYLAAVGQVVEALSGAASSGQ